MLTPLQVLASDAEAVKELHLPSFMRSSVTQGPVSETPAANSNGGGESRAGESGGTEETTHPVEVDIRTDHGGEAAGSKHDPVPPPLFMSGALLVVPGTLIKRIRKREFIELLKTTWRPRGGGRD